MQTQMIITALNRLWDHYGPQRWWQSANKVEDLVAMVLIQRTTERNAVLAMDNLVDHLSLDSLINMPLEELQDKIRPAGFFSSKSQTIKLLAQFIVDRGGFDQFDKQDTESLRKDLLTLKGIGPETADAILLYIVDRPVLVADEYARRLFSRLGFGDYQTYDQLKKASLDLPRHVDLSTCKEWHAVIDEHGKEYRRLKGDIDESWLIN